MLFYACFRLSKSFTFPESPAPVCSKLKPFITDGFWHCCKFLFVIINVISESAMTKKNPDVDNYIAGFPNETQKLLEQVRQTIREAAPEFSLSDQDNALRSLRDFRLAYKRATG